MHTMYIEVDYMVHIGLNLYCGAVYVAIVSYN